MATTSGENTAFFYGTLMVPKVLYRVIYGTPNPDPWQKERLTIQPGLIFNYRRHKVRYADYPGIYPMPASSSASVLGTIVTGLSQQDLFRLDIFEGDQYDRKHATAYHAEFLPGSEGKASPKGEGVEVMTYVWKAKYLDGLEDGEWDFEEFRREKLVNWVGGGVSRDDYEEVDEAVAALGEDEDDEESEEEEDGLEGSDPTGGRGNGGKITKQLEDLKEKSKDQEPLKSAI